MEEKLIEGLRECFTNEGAACLQGNDPVRLKRRISQINGIVGAVLREYYARVPDDRDGDDELSEDDPRVLQVAEELRSELSYMHTSYSKDDLHDGDDLYGFPVRVQLVGDSVELHTGAADYDSNHSGYWGAGFLGWDATEDQIVQLAYELVDEAVDSYLVTEGNGQ